MCKKGFSGCSPAGSSYSTVGGSSEQNLELDSKHEFIKNPSFLRNDQKNFKQVSGSYLRPKASSHMLS
jgi:hypothetical protein